MTKLATLILLAFTAITANAGTVLIDFDDVTPQYISPGNLYDVETKGFTFDAITFAASPPEAGVSSAGIWASADCFAWGGGCGSQIVMEAISGSAFSIHSIASWEGSFSGTLFGGGAADLSAPIGTGDWLSLETFRVTNICPSTPCGYWDASLDDVTASVVPIPAAAWLFGSALAGLGWIGRKRVT
jgi:hypothetical protein